MSDDQVKKDDDSKHGRDLRPCQLKATPSQIATLLLILSSTVILVKELLPTGTSQMTDGVIWATAGPLLPLLIAGFYYYVGAWLIERKLEHLLPAKGVFHFLERGIRTVALLAVPLAIPLIRAYPALRPYDVLSGFFCILLVWDGIVYNTSVLKGGRELAWGFAKWDSVCLVLSLLSVIASRIGQGILNAVFEFIGQIGLLLAVGFLLIDARSKLRNSEWPKPEWLEPAG